MTMLLSSLIWKGLPEIATMQLGPNEAAVQANIVVYTENDTEILINPKFIIRGNDLVIRPYELTQEVGSRDIRTH